jgi:hypothetical protein
LPEKRTGTLDADFAEADEWLQKIRTTGMS